MYAFMICFKIKRTIWLQTSLVSLNIDQINTYTSLIQMLIKKFIGITMVVLNKVEKPYKSFFSIPQVGKKDKQNKIIQSYIYR